jgi:putative ABC transport system permease protein
MACLPLANILHHKLRSLLSALGIACGVCMLVTLSGLARGSLSEVADRWEAVDAELIVYPLGWGENVTTLSGIGISDRYADIIRRRWPHRVDRVVPVFLWPLKIGGQDQLAAGVDAADFPVLTGGRALAAGRLFDPEGRFSRWLETTLTAEADTPDAPAEPLELDTRAAFADPEHAGLELVIDSRLAEKARLSVGDTLEAANHTWRVVGIVPAGGMARVYLPRRAAQYLFGSGSIQKSTLLFVRLAEGVDADSAARAIRSVGQEVVQLRQYRAMLQEKFGIMFRFVDTVNVLALAIAFLFIMNTLYTMVLQRTREIAILKSCGASGAFLVRQTLAESLLLTAAGTAIGLGLSFLAGWAITRYTLNTVQITPRWVLISVAAAACGAVLSALYPAWRAHRVDMVQALNME